MLIERTTYRGWKNAWRISNRVIDLVVLADVGPRVIWCGLTGAENQLYEIEEQAGLTGGDEFRLYGGHRLWVSPEVARTYYPDNAPVTVAQYGNSVSFTAPIESRAPGTNLQKEVEVHLAPDSATAFLHHRITNHDTSDTLLSVWAPTLMRAGGRAIVPLPPRAAMDNDHLLPVGQFAIWSYTDLADPRWKLGTEFIQLVQEPGPARTFREQMGGFFNPLGWGAYFHHETLFVKRARVIQGARYPDCNSNFELFTNPECLELETLGPLVNLKPGETAEHQEQWQLFGGVPAGDSEDWIRTTVAPLIEAA